MPALGQNVNLFVHSRQVVFLETPTPIPYRILAAFVAMIEYQPRHNYNKKIINFFLVFRIIFLLYFPGIGLDTTKAFYADKLRARISVKFVHRLNQVAGIALIIASLVILDKLVTHFIFSPPGG